VQNPSKIKGVSIAAVAAFGLFTGLPASTFGGGFGIDIHLGGPPPRHHDEVVVLEYDRYCVGYRQNLYDADWRLRNAQIEQFSAQDALDAARHRESEIAVVVEDREIILADYEKRVAESDGNLAAARAAVGRAADDAADARARLHAYEKRIAGAREDRDAARTLRDGAALVDAEARIRTNEAAAAQAAADLRAAEARVGDLQAAEAAAAALNDARIQLADARARLPRLREDLAIAHDNVFAAQQRLDASLQSVALAIHDRDEALWLLHRDEILSGRATLASCGFTVDLGVWGGRMPRDPEVVHAYFVHPVTYWVERPAEIHVRVAEVERVTEVTRIRTIQEKHEGPRFREVARFEQTVPLERRRAAYEHIAVERQTLVAERTERATAAAEHRAVRIPETVRAQAHAEVIKAHADGRATEIKAHADANAELTKARADAKAERIESNAKANAEVTKARADAKAEHIETHGKANAEVTKARADARTEHIEAHGKANAEETKARADARVKETEARADSRNAKNVRDDKNSKDPKKKNPNNGQQANSDPNR